MQERRLVLYRGTYCAAWREGGSTRRSSLGTADRALAEIRFEAYKADLKKETGPKKPAIVTIGACLDLYYSAKPQVYPRKALGEFFRSKLPEHLKEDICNEYVEMRQDHGIAAATIHTEMGILRSALFYAEDFDWLDKAPHVWMPERGEPRERWLTKDEAARLLAACTVPHIKLFVQISLHTAQRPGAITDLTWKQISWDLNRIDFNPPGRKRTKKGRPVVAMTDELRAVLKAEEEASLSDYVISWGGDKVGSIKKGFATAATNAGLVDVIPYTLRHTCASWMAMDGVEMRKISQMLGHTSIQVTERVYAKYHPDYMQDGVNSLAQFPIGHNEPATVNKKATGSPIARRRSRKS